MHKHLDPRQLRLRAQIISHEIAAPPGKKLRYMDNKELTEMDRQLITTSRALLSASRLTLEHIGEGPKRMAQCMTNIWRYNQELLIQLSEVQFIFRFFQGDQKWPFKPFFQ